MHPKYMENHLISEPIKIKSIAFVSIAMSVNASKLKIYATFHCSDTSAGESENKVGDDAQSWCAKLALENLDSVLELVFISS
jgi:hypothetical protein